MRHTSLGERVARVPLRPRYWTASFTAARHLWQAYGHLASVRAGSCIDATGAPIPWYTYPAIEYLRQLDFSGSRIFEYGSGHSTLFWSREAAEVVSVEDDEAWHAAIAPRLPPTCTYVLEPDLHRFVDTIGRFGTFDVIVVDGPARGRTRLKCARAALEHLRPGGLVILDNADWLPESARLLRESGLLQVDMSGFVPIGGHTQTTTLFFHRECRFAPKGGRQPHPSAAAIQKSWEDDGRPTDPGQVVEWDGQRISGVVGRASLEKTAPPGVRRFEVVIREHAADRAAFIYDLGQDRILVGPYDLPEAVTGLDAEVTRLREMPWEAFCAFVREQPTRRFLLDLSGDGRASIPLTPM